MSNSLKDKGPLRRPSSAFDSGLQKRLESAMGIAGDPAEPKVSEPTLSSSEPVSIIDRANDPVEPSVQESPSFLARLGSTVRYRRSKVALNTRIDDFVDDALVQAMRDAHDLGHRYVSKEDLISLLLMQALNIQPPPGWRI